MMIELLYLAIGLLSGLLLSVRSTKNFYIEDEAAQKIAVMLMFLMETRLNQMAQSEDSPNNPMEPAKNEL